MSDSLRDQLLALGFRKAAEPRPEPKPAPRQQGKPRAHPGAGPPRPPQANAPAKQARPQQQRRDAQAPAGGPPAATRAEIDLAKAYAIRAQSERAEKQRAEQAQAELSRQKKERKTRLAALLQDKSRNAADADIARNFSYGEKIRRIYVTAAQLKALNAGELGVVQHMGRFVLVERDVALAAQAIWPEALALLPDPNAVADDDVPADLVW